MKAKAIVLIGVLLLAGIPLFAAYDAFLKIDSIPGESTAPGHTGWIQLTSFSWTTGAHGAGGGGGAGKCAVHAFTITKLVDKSTPKLAELALRGTPIPSMTLEINGERHMLQNVMISSVRQAASGGGNSIPTESISFNFTKCETHEVGNNTFNPALKYEHKDAFLKIDQKGAPGGMFSISGGPQGPIALHDIHFAGRNSAIITVGADQLLLPAVRRAFDAKKRLPSLTLSGYQTGGSAPSPDHKGQQFLTFTFTDVLISSFSPAGNQFTVNFGRLEGPMTDFHDVFPK